MPLNDSATVQTPHNSPVFANIQAEALVRPSISPVTTRNRHRRPFKIRQIRKVRPEIDRRRPILSHPIINLDPAGSRRPTLQINGGITTK